MIVNNNGAKIQNQENKDCVVYNDEAPQVSIEDERRIQIKIVVDDKDIPRWDYFRELSKSLQREGTTLVPWEYKVEDYKPEGFGFPIPQKKLITMRLIDRKNILLEKIMELMLQEIYELGNKQIDVNKLPIIDKSERNLFKDGKKI
jgi:hypothetical protein